MKTMQVGRLMAWTLVIAMPLWFGSCKKENGGGGGGGDVVTPKSVEGNWKISAMSVSDGTETKDYFELIKDVAGEDGEKIVACLTDITITFNHNGTVSGADSPKCQSTGADEYNPATKGSTWKVTGDKLIITSGTDASSYDLTLNGNAMTWSIQEQEDTDEDGVKETYKTTITLKRV